MIEDTPMPSYVANNYFLTFIENYVKIIKFITYVDIKPLKAAVLENVDEFLKIPVIELLEYLLLGIPDIVAANTPLQTYKEVEYYVYNIGEYNYYLDTPLNKEEIKIITLNTINYVKMFLENIETTYRGEIENMFDVDEIMADVVIPMGDIIVPTRIVKDHLEVFVMNKNKHWEYNGKSN